METWYLRHHPQVRGPRDDDAAAELLEELMRRAPTDRVADLSRRVLALPWNEHLAEIFSQCGFHNGTFPNGVGPNLVEELRRRGFGANPTPFVDPALNPCELRRKQTVLTERGRHVVDRVLVVGDTLAYGFVKNLQNCIYGKVVHAIELRWTPQDDAWRATGAQTAVKCIQRDRYDSHMARRRGVLNEDPIKEISVMQHTTAASPNVLRMLGSYLDDSAVYVVLPYLPHGDLYGVVEKYGALDERRAFTLFRNVLDGLESLHADGMAHHDLSLENVMLDSDNAAVIIDFGMAVKIPVFSPTAAETPRVPIPLRPSDAWPCRCGKLVYMAPELYMPRESFDVFAADVWACGVILFIMLTGLPPWDTRVGPDPNDSRFALVRNGQLDRLLRHWDIRLQPDAVDILQRLLTANPAKRITIPRIKQHLWWRRLQNQESVPR